MSFGKQIADAKLSQKALGLLSKIVRSKQSIPVIALLLSVIALFQSCQANEFQKKEVDEERTLFWRGQVENGRIHFLEVNSQQFPLSIKVLAPYRQNLETGLSDSFISAEFGSDHYTARPELNGFSVPSNFSVFSDKQLIKDAWYNASTYSNVKGPKNTGKLKYFEFAPIGWTNVDQKEIVFITPILVKTEFTKHGEVYESCGIYELQKTLKLKYYVDEIKDIGFVAEPQTIFFRYSVRNHDETKKTGCNGEALLNVLPSYQAMLSKRLIESAQDDGDFLTQSIRNNITDSVSKKRNANVIVESIEAEDIGKQPEKSIRDSLRENNDQ